MIKSRLKELIRNIVKYEELKLYPYVLDNDSIVVGIGRVISDDGISYDEALFLLGNDLETIERALNSYGWYSTLPDNIKHALIHLCFFCKLSRVLDEVDFINALALNDFKSACIHLINSHLYNINPARVKDICVQIRQSMVSMDE